MRCISPLMMMIIALIGAAVNRLHTIFKLVPVA